MRKRDYFEILGVGRDATQEEIKKSYRRLALKYHPDRNPGDAQSEEFFKEAAEAYEVLHDPQKRKIYEQFGHEDTGKRLSGLSPVSTTFSLLSATFSKNFSDSAPGPVRGASRTGDGPALRPQDLFP